jgi:hypothetical protein
MKETRHKTTGTGSARTVGRVSMTLSTFRTINARCKLPKTNFRKAGMQEGRKDKSAGGAAFQFFFLPSCLPAFLTSQSWEAMHRFWRAVDCLNTMQVDR